MPRNLCCVRRVIKRSFNMCLTTVVSEVPLGIKFLQKLTDVCCPRLHFNRELWYIKISNNFVKIVNN